MAMATKKAKPRQSGHPGKPSRSAKQGYSVTERKASPNRSSRGQKAKLNAAQGNRKLARAPVSEPPPEPRAAPSPPPPSPAPAELTPETVQRRAEELLDELARLAFNYHRVAWDDMWVHRSAAHPNLMYTARILKAVVRANDSDDGAWLKTQAGKAKVYLHEHRDDPRPPAAKFRGILSYERPEAANHMKRFVRQRIEGSSKDGRVSYEAISTVSRQIAEVLVGNLIGGGAIELAWEFLPGLRQDLDDDESTRAHVAHEIRRIISNAEPFQFEKTAEVIVRKVLQELGYESTKGLFDFERKAGQVADRSQAGTQAAAEAPDGVPLPERNK